MSYVLCGECQYWVETAQVISGNKPADFSIGDCRRRAPLTFNIKTSLGGHRQETKWPTTRSNDGCGDGAPLPHA